MLTHLKPDIKFPFMRKILKNCNHWCKKDVRTNSYAARTQILFVVYAGLCLSYKIQHFYKMNIGSFHVKWPKIVKVGT